MSELRTFDSERIYWAVDQVEQEAGDIDTRHLDDALFYLKSEADKVIEELKRDIANWTDSYEISRKTNARTESELRHNKYKRCLAMAEVCNARYDEADAKVNGRGASWDYISDEMKYWERWRDRWPKLAEKFNGNNNGNSQCVDAKVRGKLGRVCKSCTDKYCQFPIQRISFKEALKRHFKAVKDATCNCLFCRNLNKEPK